MRRIAANSVACGLRTLRAMGDYRRALFEFAPRVLDQRREFARRTAASKIASPVPGSRSDRSPASAARTGAPRRRRPPASGRRRRARWGARRRNRAPFRAHRRGRRRSPAFRTPALRPGGCRSLLPRRTRRRARRATGRASARAAPRRRIRHWGPPRRARERASGPSPPMIRRRSGRPRNAAAMRSIRLYGTQRDAAK